MHRAARFPITLTRLPFPVPQTPLPIPADARRSLFVYNLFFPLVFLALLPGFLSRMFRRGGFRENFGQRLGTYDPATHARFASGRWWWIHSISVGETLVALKLAHELHRREPGLRLALTVTTSTGYALAAASRADWLEVLYNPIDARSIVAAALDLIRPECLVLIEGEAWPNLLAACRTRGIRTALVNARLSPRSERRYLRALYWIAPIFRLIDDVFVPEEADVSRWLRLGIPPPAIRVTGSIKFDSAGDFAPERTVMFRELLDSLSIPRTAPILLAGSTWAPEEKIIAETFLVLRREFPDIFLIIAPRHVERTAEILRDLAPFGLKTIRRTEFRLAQPEAPSPQLLLIDTTGELRDWYPLATVVFIGKSLPGVAEEGGQNPAEPAALGKPVVAGPHMENFASLVALLASHQAITTVDAVTELPATVRHLLRNPAERIAMADRSRTALAAHLHATARTAAALTGRP